MKKRSKLQLHRETIALLMPRHLRAAGADDWTCTCCTCCYTDCNCPPPPTNEYSCYGSCDCPTVRGGDSCPCF